MRSLRWAAAPRAVGCLLSQEGGAPALARYLRALGFPVLARTILEISHDLPADCRIAFEEPVDDLVGHAGHR